MNRTALLQETSAWTDTVDLALCHLTSCHRATEREPAHLLHGVLRLADHQAARAWQALGGGVPATLRHIQVIL